MLRKSVAIALLLVPLMAAVVSAQGSERVSVGTIKAALRTAEPEEHGFVEYVVHLADVNILPRSILNGTFRWACKKPVRYRFQYFKRALIIRARRVGVSL
jgi:hypothetical protein